MTIAHWLTVFGIVTATFVGLYAAYEQRRTVRHLELFKRDPSVGIAPPLSPFLRVLGVVVKYLVAFGPTAAIALWFVYEPGVPSRLSVLLLAIALATAAVNASLFVVLRMLRHLAGVLAGELTKQLLVYIDKRVDARASLPPADQPARKS